MKWYIHGRAQTGKSYCRKLLHSLSVYQLGKMLVTERRQCNLILKKQYCVWHAVFVINCVSP